MGSLHTLRRTAFAVLVTGELLLFLVPFGARHGESSWLWLTSRGIEAGSWPDWIVAVATVLAVVFAGVAAKAAIQTNKAQARQIEMILNEQQRVRDASTRQQASQVSFWVDSDENKQWVLKIINSSNLPISDLTLRSRDLDNYSGSTSIQEILENSSFVNGYAVVPPTGAVPHRIFASQWATDLYFRDASGNRWLRTSFGQLMEVSPQDYIRSQMS